MKNTIDRFYTFFKESSLFIRLLIVVSVIGVIAGTAIVTAIMAAPKDTKLNHATIGSKAEQKISDEEEPIAVSDDEKSDEAVPSQAKQQLAPRQPTSTIEESAEGNSTVTVADIPKDLFGWSEYHAYRRRIEVGRPDAIKGVAAGHLFAKIYCSQHSLTTAPSKYAILCIPSGGTRGHVAFVEEIKDNGDIRVTEMNYTSWNKLSERIIPKDQAENYRYIP